MKNPEKPFTERVYETFVEREYEKMEREQKFQDKATKYLNKKLKRVLPVTLEDIAPWELIPADTDSIVSWERFHRCVDTDVVAYTEIDGVGISAPDSTKETGFFYMCQEKPEPYFDQDGRRFRESSIRIRNNIKLPELYGGRAFHDTESFVEAMESLENPSNY